MTPLIFSKARKLGLFAVHCVTVACGSSGFRNDTFDDDTNDGGREPDAARATDSSTTADATSERDTLPEDGDASDARADGAPDGGTTNDDGGLPTDAACDARHSWYRDDDEDGYGAGAAVASCAATPPAGLSATNDDCNEESPLVNPGQTEFFETAYESPAGPSFDYDCSGDETPDPTNDHDEAPTCPPTLIGCSGMGYLPLDPPRAGNDDNPLCGSVELRSCVSAAFCFAQVTETPNAFRCR